MPDGLDASPVLVATPAAEESSRPGRSRVVSLLAGGRFCLQPFLLDVGILPKQLGVTLSAGDSAYEAHFVLLEERRDVVSTGVAIVPRFAAAHNDYGSAKGVLRCDTAAMTSSEIDAYLAGLSPVARTTLAQVRSSIREALPEAEEGISYGLPAFRMRGKVVAGFAAFKNHLSYLPHSGSVLPALAEDLAGYQGTKGSLHFPLDEPLPEELVRKLIATRLAQLGMRANSQAGDDV
jgi:uncharacterized protein YdhG (YjbR/CyaY superfamily)